MPTAQLPRRVLESLDAIPVLSTSAAEAIGLFNDPDVGAEQLDAVIRLDPLLTAQFLRLSNSAAFGTGQVTTVQDAITRLGWKRSMDVVASAALHDVVPGWLPGYQMDATSFWSHCVSVAVLAEGFASNLATASPPTAFVCGLLHDVGRLALGVMLEEESVDLLASVGAGTLEDFERDRFGTDHNEVGAVLLESWGLPETFQLVCRHHHDPSQAPEEMRPLVDIVHAADSVAYMLGFGIDAVGLRHETHMDVIRALGLDEERLQSVVIEHVGTIHKLSDMLGVAS